MNHRTGRLAVALLVCALPGCTGPAPAADPDAARLVTEDIPRFWQAFDARERLGTAEALETLYLQPGTPGLLEWKSKHLDDAVTLAQTVDTCAAYYASARASTPEDPKQRPQDLGYFIGYRIVQAFFERVDDQRAAIREIVLMDDPEAFLARSGYAEQWR